jgi:hypothetical protein
MPYLKEAHKPPKPHPAHTKIGLIPIASVKRRPIELYKGAYLGMSIRLKFEEILFGNEAHYRAFINKKWTKINGHDITSLCFLIAKYIEKVKENEQNSDIPSPILPAST